MVNFFRNRRNGTKQKKRKVSRLRLQLRSSWIFPSNHMTRNFVGQKSCSTVLRWSVGIEPTLNTFDVSLFTGKLNAAGFINFTQWRFVCSRTETNSSAREIASMAPPAERERYTESAIEATCLSPCRNWSYTKIPVKKLEFPYIAIKNHTSKIGKKQKNSFFF